MASQNCTTEGCGAPATLQCPTCIKLNVQGSFFCTQECFKKSWSLHKIVHKSSKVLAGSNNVNAMNGESYNPWPGFRFTGLLRPYPLSPRRLVPDTIKRPDYALKGTSNIKTLTEDEIEGMRVACKLGREVLDEAAKVIGVNVTTDEIDRVVHEACIDRDCYPSTLNYHKFPKSCCTSVNEVICHGVPDMRPLRSGDICNVKVTVLHNGFYGDLSETFRIGEVEPEASKLVLTTWLCLQKAIALVKPGVKYRDVGNVIQKHAQKEGFSVVRSYYGHGIHRVFQTVPYIPHHAENNAVGVMMPGHCFTLEPILSEGTWQDEQWPDHWTDVTMDGKLSAQFEETLLVTETGVEILTRRVDRDGQPYFAD